MLNTTHFTVLAGDPSAWDEETRRRCRVSGDLFNSEDLCKVQIEQFGRGRRSAELVSTIYGWGVRSATNLDGRAIIFRARRTPDGQPGSKADAIAAGIAWANEDPKNREFYARNSDLTESA